MQPKCQLFDLAANLVRIRVHTLQEKALASIADCSRILPNPRRDRGKVFQ